MAGELHENRITPSPVESTGSVGGAQPSCTRLIADPRDPDQEHHLAETLQITAVSDISPQAKPEYGHAGYERGDSWPPLLADGPNQIHCVPPCIKELEGPANTRHTDGATESRSQSGNGYYRAVPLSTSGAGLAGLGRQLCGSRVVRAVGHVLDVEREQIA